MVAQDVIDAQEAARAENFSSAATLAKNAVADVSDYADLPEGSVAFEKMQEYALEVEKEAEKSKTVGETPNKSHVLYCLKELRSLVTRHH